MTAIEPWHGHDWVLEQLGRYVDYETSDRETEQVAEHIADCKLCQRNLLELGSVERAFARGEPQSELPPGYRERLLARLRAEPSNSTS